MTLDIRWKQRFESYERALLRLRAALESGVSNLSELEQEGTIQRFEVTLELAWKLLKDYLEFQGIRLTPVTPRQVVEEALAARVLPDGQVWIDMLEHRNLLAHTYSQHEFGRAILTLEARYFPALEALYSLFQSKLADT